MYQLNNFDSREQLDESLADKISKILQSAISLTGKASLAVSGGSTPKGFFKALSNKSIEWKKVTITLADERWVDINSDDSNTKLVHENLLINKAASAKFFHLKQGDELCDETLADLNLAANHALLPLDVVILGMGEDGHTASLFPCSDEIEQGLDVNNVNSLMKVQPKTAPHQRITFSFSALKASKNVFLHVCGDNKKQVLDKALSTHDIFEMPIRAFLHNDVIDTQIYWAK
ncbi:6-phosphogluconolactonase [Colwellia sp. 4_MG-2023]|jgi:6-phosphogluconolactonase|uniref:6-phosphogluconolactonase n=1 Tax=unclassified Colwellia TaxID=196834 RepID=UPI001C0893D7|nr:MULTISPECIES: 6-phosphogluconolactonase [unclassified Colwellia]MBU2924310.1 6-phosphogluconolactonase [Colwellia sp. C2M11]MDO6505467.1 6-phosphogluconolactonase [Colwellia sp. 5_MG-2023]MDO6554237.1 6-phosphogluconolactonase [Colwellia sp. 4_MG-2023]MDO6650888.1 6-phosphogluconolactonase [Colwellia sp. 3_MG-2023]MDO6663923.1 6-phosphogluconolactonase [Colwellia sp. 2_MG-2023]